MERQRPPLRVRVAAGISLMGAAIFACDGQDKPGPVSGNIPTESPVATSAVPAVKTLQPSEKATPVIVKTATGELPKTSVTANPTSQSSFSENTVARFSGSKTSIEIKDAESLRSLSEFTIMARVKLDGVPPDAIVAKGDEVEAYALFATIASCLDSSMAIVIDDKNFCSQIPVKRNEFVNVAVAFKDNKAKFFSGDVESNNVPVTTKVPEEFGPLSIGASPKGIFDENLSGQLDFVTIVGRSMSKEEIAESFRRLQSGDVNGFNLNVKDVRVLLTFDDKNNPFKDLSGKSNDGNAVGAVSLVSVN